MLVTEKTTITAVTVTMTKREAEDLAAFLEAEHFRRRQKFEETDVMQCWICLGVCEDLFLNLKRAGIQPQHL